MIAVPPKRLYRTRHAHAFTPPGAIYVGRPTMWGNPFANRRRIGHARSIIAYDAWIRGDLTPYILGRMGFGEHEIASLDRWRDRLIARLPAIRGRDLQCWCPPSSDWCHADVLLRIANSVRRAA